MLNALFNALENNLVPDALVRVRLRQRIDGVLARQQEANPGDEAVAEGMRHLKLRGPAEPVPATEFDLTTDLFANILGPRMLHASLAVSGDDLGAAEEASLARIVENADIQPGQKILILGEEFGALANWLAETVENVELYSAVPNEAAMQAVTDGVQAGIADLQSFSPDQFAWPKGLFDRIIAIETLDLVPNYQPLFERMARWLNADGLVLIQAVTHCEYSYHLAADGDDDWMSQYFMDGKLVVSPQLFAQFSDDLTVAQVHEFTGTQYADTAKAWLANLDANKEIIMPILASIYGEGEEAKWLQRWRMVLMTLQERYAKDDGTQWFAAQYILQKA